MAVKYSGTDIVMNGINATIQVGKMIPFVAEAAALCEMIFNMAQTALHNKAVCKALAARVKNKQDWLVRESPPAENCRNTYLTYIEVLKEIRDYIKELKDPGPFTSRFILKVKRTLGANDVAAMHADLEERLDKAQKDFHLDLSYDTNSVVKDANGIGKDTNSRLRDADKKLDELLERERKRDENQVALAMYNKGVEPSANDIKATKLDFSHFEDEDDEEDSVTRGKIEKKMYHMQIVALKKIGNLKQIPKAQLARIDKEAVLFSRLSDCTKIEKFYGTTINADILYIATEWAEHGDLEKYLRANPNLEWKHKIKFAEDIAIALAWCHSVEIFHHDVRSHSVLIDENLTAKLTNFQMSRFGTDATTSITNMTANSRWTAPEKLQANIPYSKKMDVYSFGIVMWEISAQDKPFGEIINDMEVMTVVSKNIRPQPIPEDTPEGYKLLMKQAWHEKPNKRPAMEFLSKELHRVGQKYRKYSSTSSISSMSDSISTLDVPSIAQRPGTPLPEIEGQEYGFQSSDDLGIDLSDLIITDLPSWEDVYQMIKDKSIKKAFPYIEEHAKQGNAVAQYYAGRYLYEGQYVERDEDQALAYLCQAADTPVQYGQRTPAHISYAQFTYAHGCLKGSSYDQTAGIEYLKKAVRNGQPQALLFYGEILLDGLYGQPIRLDEAEKMLKAYKRMNPQELETESGKKKFEKIVYKLQIYKKQAGS